MNLLLIITDYSGFNNFLSELALRMIDDGHQVNVICSPDKVISYEDRLDFSNLGVQFHFVQFPRGYNLYKQVRASIKIFKLVNLIKPDLVHVHFTTGIFTTLLYGRLPYKVLGTIHGLGYPATTGIRQKILTIVEYFCINRLDQVCVLNKSDLELIRKTHGDKCFMLDHHGLGCDLARFNPERFVNIRNDLKNQLCISENQFVLAFTGRFVNFKGFDLVVRSFFKLNEDHPNHFKLLLIGGRDPIHPTGLTKDEEKMLAENNQVVQIGFTNEVEKYLAVADLFVFPSLKEGMPVCVMEALAMGIPVITANTEDVTS
jgi:glycosyltransferase involved in cell wall biosynthesis